MLTKLAKLKTDLLSLRKTRDANFLDSVRKYRRGDKCPAAEVDAMLVATGKTEDEFVKAAELNQERHKQCQLLQTIPGLNAERESLQSKITEADKALEKAREAHSAAVSPLHGRTQMIDSKIAQAISVEEFLSQTCQDEQLIAELDEVLAEQREVSNRKSALQRIIRAGHNDERHARHLASIHGRHSEAVAFDERGTALVSRESELAALDAEFGELQGRETAIRAEMLKP